MCYLVGLRRHVVLTGPVVQSVPLVRLVPEVHFHLWDPSHPVGRHFPIDRVPRRRPLDQSLPSDPMDLYSSSNQSYIASDYFSVISAAIQLYESQKYTTYKCIRARRGSILHLLVLADHVVRLVLVVLHHLGRLAGLEDQLVHVTPARQWGRWVPLLRRDHVVRALLFHL